MKPITRFTLLSVLFAATPLVDCVGDEPSTGSTTDDGGAASDGTTTSDGSNPGDGGTGTDAGADPCDLGSTNCPSKQGGTHLQLWLRGDKGLECAGGRVVAWHDQSGHARDVTLPTYVDGGLALAPQCGQSMNGRGVVTFTDPAGGPPFVDEILNADLSFLVGSSYTISIVHRPLLPESDSTPRGLLAAVRSTPIYIGFCSTNAPLTNDGTLDIAYGFDGGTVLRYDEFPHCGGYTSAAYSRGVATVDTFVFTANTGPHLIYADGVLVFSGTAEGDDSTNVLADAGNLSPGVIGRDSNDGLVSGGDGRYAGDIAEILIYDTPLSTELTPLATYEKAVWNVP